MSISGEVAAERSADEVGRSAREARLPLRPLADLRPPRQRDEAGAGARRREPPRSLHQRPALLPRCPVTVEIESGGQKHTERATLVLHKRGLERLERDKDSNPSLAEIGLEPRLMCAASAAPRRRLLGCSRRWTARGCGPTSGRSTSLYEDDDIIAVHKPAGRAEPGVRSSERAGRSRHFALANVPGAARQARTLAASLPWRASAARSRHERSRSLHQTARR